MPTDAELLRAWKGGDRAAGKALFERTFGGLRRFFRGKASDTAEVDDLIQRTLLAVVERSDQLEDDQRFRAYLFTVARHELFAFYRRRGRQTEAFDSQVLSAQQLVPSPTGLLAQRADERALLAALRRIPLDLQIALELYYWEGMRTAEVGEVLGVGPSTTTTRLARARELLRRELGAMDSVAISTQGDLEQWVRAMKDRVGESEP